MRTNSTDGSPGHNLRVFALNNRAQTMSDVTVEIKEGKSGQNRVNDAVCEYSGFVIYRILQYEAPAGGCCCQSCGTTALTGGLAQGLETEKR